MKSEECFWENSNFQQLDSNLQKKIFDNYSQAHQLRSVRYIAGNYCSQKKSLELGDGSAGGAGDY